MVCGKSVLVCGYGEVGKGIVSSLKSLGKKIIIEELHSANTFFYFNKTSHFVSYFSTIQKHAIVLYCGVAKTLQFSPFNF